MLLRIENHFKLREFLLFYNIIQIILIIKINQKLFAIEYTNNHFEKVLCIFKLFKTNFSLILVIVQQFLAQYAVQIRLKILQFLKIFQDDIKMKIVAQFELKDFLCIFSFFQNIFQEIIYPNSCHAACAGVQFKDCEVKSTFFIFKIKLIF